MTATIYLLPTPRTMARVERIERRTQSEARIYGQRVKLIPLPVVTRNPDDPNGKGAA